MAGNLIIKFKQGDIWLDNIPLCTLEQITRAEAVIEAEYPKLANLLSSGHVWREGKALHGVLAQKVGQEILQELGFKSNDPNSRLILFIGRYHDLGRIIDALQRDRKPIPPQFKTLANHGAFSVQVLKDWHIIDGIFEHDASSLISYAITHHVDNLIPTLPDNPTRSEQIRYIILSLVRDMDKLANFQGKTWKYLYDGDEIAKQTRIVQEMLWQDYQIKYEGCSNSIPTPVIDRFCQQEVLVHQDCTTYEAYMLYFLSWIFDLNLTSVLQRVVDSYAIYILLNWFAIRLERSQADEIQRTVVAYFKSTGVVLEPSF